MSRRNQPHLRSVSHPRRIFHCAARRNRFQSTFKLLAISATLLGVALAGGIWHLGVAPALAEANGTKHNIVVRKNNHFAVQGVKLGMSAGEVRRLFPGMLTKVRGTKRTGHFLTDGVAHSVWFTPGANSGAVYRIQYRETYSRLSTDDIITRFGSEFGQPIVVDCRQGASASRQGPCRLQWLTRDGVKLDVRSRITDPLRSGRPVTTLTVTATDTATANKLTTLRLAGLI